MSSSQPNRPGAIVVDQLWKRFHADRSRPVLRDEVSRLTERLHGRSDPRRWRWALRDLRLEIEPGEAIGLFGANGSGKSTLLKILTRVMYPTAGSVRIGGRVGALIEVRAGVHPDLTGRENIFLYGNILGLRRADIARRFDAIVEFADLADAVDRQLKFYSSGMAMRLGFAVAAFLQPDILLVDEVLAVGDATFQQRCLERMRAVLNEGTTLVFVSHDLASVESISIRGLWLRNGELAADGPIRDSLAAYRRHIESSAVVGSAEGDLVGITAAVAGPDGEAPQTGAPMRIDLRLTAARQQRALAFIGVSEGSAAPVFSLSQELILDAGENSITCSIDTLPLPRGQYSVWVAVTDTVGADLTPWHPVTHFHVLGADLDPGLPGVMRLSPVYVDARWERDPSTNGRDVSATTESETPPLRTTPG